MLLRFTTSVLLLSCYLCLCHGSPVSDDEWLAEVDNLPLEPRTDKEPKALETNSNVKNDVSPHLLNMEHKASYGDAPVKTAFKSIGLGAVDSVVSGVVTLAGGVVEDIGDLVVSTVNQLPRTIKTVSDMVGSAVDFKRDKVNLVANTVGLNDDSFFNPETLVNSTIEVVDKSKTRDSFGRLEEAFGSLLGKIIAVSFKNAGEISTAFNDGISRIGRPDITRERRLPPLLPIFRTRIIKVLEGRDQHPLSYHKTKISKFIEAETTDNLKDAEAAATVLSESKSDSKVNLTS